MDFTQSNLIQERTDMIMEILCEENDEVTFVNYYLEAQKLIKTHFLRKGVTITDEAAYAMVRSVVKEMVMNHQDIKQFIVNSYSRDIYKAFEVALAGQVRRL